MFIYTVYTKLTYLNDPLYWVNEFAALGLLFFYPFLQHFIFLVESQVLINSKNIPVYTYKIKYELLLYISSLTTVWISDALKLTMQAYTEPIHVYGGILYFTLILV